MTQKLIFVYRFLSSIPFIFYALFMAFVLRAKELLGFFPSYGKPDPSSLHLDNHMFMIYVFGLLAVLTFVIWLFLSIYLILKKQCKYKDIIYYGLSWIVIGVMLFIDFGHFFVWFLD